MFECQKASACCSNAKRHRPVVRMPKGICLLFECQKASACCLNAKRHLFAFDLTQAFCACAAGRASKCIHAACEWGVFRFLHGTVVGCHTFADEQLPQREAYTTAMHKLLIQFLNASRFVILRWSLSFSLLPGNLCEYEKEKRQ